MPSSSADDDADDADDAGDAYETWADAWAAEEEVEGDRAVAALRQEWEAARDKVESARRVLVDAAVEAGQARTALTEAQAQRVRAHQECCLAEQRRSMAEREMGKAETVWTSASKRMEKAEELLRVATSLMSAVERRVTEAREAQEAEAREERVEAREERVEAEGPPLEKDAWTEEERDRDARRAEAARREKERQERMAKVEEEKRCRQETFLMEAKRIMKESTVLHRQKAAAEQASRENQIRRARSLWVKAANTMTSIFGFEKDPWRQWSDDTLKQTLQKKWREKSKIVAADKHRETDNASRANEAQKAINEAKDIFIEFVIGQCKGV